MELHKFIAGSASEAVKEIRKKLGPNAVVVQVQPSEPTGLRRWFGRSQIEVLAHVPEQRDEPQKHASHSEPGLINRIPEDWLPTKGGTTLAGLARSYSQENTPSVAPGESSVLRQFVANSGLLPCFAEDITLELEKINAGREGNMSSHEEVKMFHRWMASCWRASTPANSCGIHLFIGAPGVGKSTIISKWLSLAVLNERLSARVVRLDGETANVSDKLELHSEMLGAVVSRSMEDIDIAPEDVVFLDLPGGDLGDKRYLNHVRSIIQKARGAVQVHLVLNAAYDSLNLLRQCRAAEQLPEVDLIVTRLDEEERWGKIWNLFLATKFSLCYMNAGQNIPGEFMKPDLQRVLQQQFPAKAATFMHETPQNKVGKAAAKEG